MNPMKGLLRDYRVSLRPVKGSWGIMGHPGALWFTEDGRAKGRRTSFAPSALRVGTPSTSMQAQPETLNP